MTFDKLWLSDLASNLTFAVLLTWHFYDKTKNEGDGTITS